MTNRLDKLERPRGSVIKSGELMMMRGQRKLFQEPMKAKTATVAIAGFDSGSTSVKKLRMWPAPSMKAASSSSRGRPRKA